MPLRLSFPLLFAHARRKGRTVSEVLNGSKWVDDLRHDLSTQLILEFVQIWCEVALWPNCSGIATAICHASASIDSFHERMISATQCKHRQGIKSMFILTCWAIWRERNSRVFNDKKFSFCQICCFIKDEAHEWAFAGAKALRKLLWQPP
ncbi:hypothetical protein BRADI_4g09765v3 [Brachypodium distachyon]|uniref:Reverse transcriptase zinc-binding domain-containing protein n=1 Tax=Brachypodium distachyon TaxID=15368 RepID=A0A2K2CLN0_BRADI|nr:hypothetical protein BRADI_4g09765v3 [Brachypodium distachyon]